LCKLPQRLRLPPCSSRASGMSPWSFAEPKLGFVSRGNLAGCTMAASTPLGRPSFLLFSLAGRPRENARHYRRARGEGGRALKPLLSGRDTHAQKRPKSAHLSHTTPFSSICRGEAGGHAARGPFTSIFGHPVGVVVFPVVQGGARSQGGGLRLRRERHPLSHDDSGSAGGFSRLSRHLVTLEGLPRLAVNLSPSLDAFLSFSNFGREATFLAQKKLLAENFAGKFFSDSSELQAGRASSGLSPCCPAALTNECSTAHPSEKRGGGGVCR